MANYKNTRGRSYAQRRRSSSSGILKTLGAVLVIFLVIGLLGSLFYHPSSTTKPDVKDPTVPEETVPEESVPEESVPDATIPDGLITFKIVEFDVGIDTVSREYVRQAEPDMTWEEWCASDYNPDDTHSTGYSIEFQTLGGPTKEITYEDSTLVKPFDVITANAVYYYYFTSVGGGGSD